MDPPKKIYGNGKSKYFSSCRLKSDRIENNGNGIHDKRTDEMANIVKSLLLCTPAIEMFSVSVLMLGPSKCNNQYLLYLFVS